jgi:hypothetical protein
MNTKILELAHAATRKYDRLGFEIPFAQPDLEEFAELIIQECIKAAKEDPYPMWAEQGDEREAIAEMINKRFKND